MTDEGSLLSPQNARDYLVDQGFMQGGEEVSVRALGGGVSNIVLLVGWRGPNEQRWVIKQSLEKLRVKGTLSDQSPCPIKSHCRNVTHSQTNSDCATPLYGVTWTNRRGYGLDKALSNEALWVERFTNRHWAEN